MISFVIRTERAHVGVRRYECTGSEELLQRVRGAEADLDRWFGMQDVHADTEASVLALRDELAAAAVALSRSRR